MKKTTLLLLALVAILLASCGSSKEVPYLIDAKQLPQDVLNAAARMTDPIIMAGDMLHINVSAPDAEAIKPFKRSEYVSRSNNISNDNMYYYLVDNNGNIEFPLLGTLHVAGMNVAGVQELIASQIYPRYLTVKPGIEARIENFRVFTLGEVSNPGVVRSPNGRLNLLEAIAQSGDLTIKGRRDNIMIVRTNADGSRSIYEIGDEKEA